MRLADEEPSPCPLPEGEGKESAPFAPRDALRAPEGVRAGDEGVYGGHTALPGSSEQPASLHKQYGRFTGSS